ncbi:MAG: hypothetical protein IKL65_03915 [Bacilli bacterium]|nr:hypothetical protein [Bacilli bacterium]
MKKIILLVVLLLVCGCSKKLTCTYEEEYEDISINNKIVFNFKENTYEQEDVMVFKDIDSAKDYYKDIEAYVDEYNLILEQNKIISELSGEIKLDATEEEIKEQYESYDYKCK